MIDSLKDIAAWLKQVALLAETQKRHEEDIKRFNEFVVQVSTTLQRLSDKVDRLDERTKADIENLTRQTAQQLEIHALKTQLSLQQRALKPKPNEEDDETGSDQ